MSSQAKEDARQQEEKLEAELDTVRSTELIACRNRVVTAICQVRRELREKHKAAMDHVHDVEMWQESTRRAQEGERRLKAQVAELTRCLGDKDAQVDRPCALLKIVGRTHGDHNGRLCRSSNFAESSRRRGRQCPTFGAPRVRPRRRDKGPKSSLVSSRQWR
jgi:hypothetical protein